MELIDMHTHTELSGHGIGTVEEVVRAAIGRGLTTIALTEHLPLPTSIDPDGAVGMTDDQVAIYLDAVDEARLAFPQIEIICGVEIDWRVGAEPYILERIAPFEILLGSVHMLSDAAGNTWEFDHPDYLDGWQERGEENVWKTYFQLWRDAVCSAVPFTVMAHPDLPKKFGFKPHFDTREYYAAMADETAARDLLIEVNTSGLRKSVGELYPGPELLKAFCDAGVGCTISSDAHSPADVGRDLDKACIAMRRAGYSAVTALTRSGDRRFIALDTLC